MALDFNEFYRETHNDVALQSHFDKICAVRRDLTHAVESHSFN